MKNRETLENELKKNLRRYNRDKDIENHVLNGFAERGYENGYSLFTSPVKMESVSDILLGVFAKLIYEASGDKEVNPDLYYFENEIKMIDNFEIGEDNPIFPIVFRPVIRIGNVYAMSLSLQQLHDIHNKNIINYNEEAQRNHVFLSYGNNIIEKIDLDKTARDTITRKMSKSDYKEDFISLNILKDEKFDPDFIHYDDSTLTLTIKGGTIEILDGFHRYMGMVGLYNLDPTFNFEIGLKISNYSLGEAKDAVEQFNKQRKINIEQEKSLSEENYANLVTDEINKDTKSMFRTKIVKTRVLIDKKMGYTYFSTVSESVGVLFGDELRTSLDVNPISKYLIDCFNNIYAIFYDDFVKCNDSDLKTHRNTFVVYTAIAKYLYEGQPWSDDKRIDLQLILDEIDFSKDGELSEVLKLNTITEINTRVINRVYDFIDDKFKSRSA